ncbi:hypothetical protein K438DRAFT_1901685 [Mycena galopus ATCC 62051]|nr:hypothetical protein K438DRAFT_1901685 [Mycena galopus ATCC 62051]
MTLIELPSQSNEEKIVVLQHDQAADFLASAYPTLRLHEASANILLAHALVRAPVESVLTECKFITSADVQAKHTSSQPVSAPNLWLTVWLQRPKFPPVLELALSCIGTYPVFMWTPVEPGLQSSQWLDSRIRAVAAHLHACIAPERVFAAFGTTALVTTFADAWTGLTGIQIDAKPLYKAFSALCTRQTIKMNTSAEKCGARRATMHDVEAAGKLCQEFANCSEYPMNLADATAEAQQLIEKGQLWVGTLMGEIASICAVTRSSLHVSAITKVFTTPNARRNGLAQALVQEVTGRLFDSGKHSVVLYVDCDNRARRVYERVGFQIEDVEIWLELGFVGTIAGHW